MTNITFAEVQAAHQVLKSVAHRTPIHQSTTINQLTGANVFFKCENFQRGGAFKFRGAYYAVSQLSDEEKHRGVITHSSGNHGQALAYAAKLHNIPATVVMIENSSPVKVNAVRDTYGATVVFCENSMQAREATTDALVAEHQYTFIHPSSNDDVIRGAGTAALELLTDQPDLDLIITPVGGGGLLSGSAIATKGINPNCEVWAAEPKLMDDAYHSLQSGNIEANISFDTVADGLKSGLSPRTFSIIQKHVQGIVRVEEDAIIDALQIIWERMKIIVEPSSSTVLAALLSGELDIKGKKVGAILSGGNLDLAKFIASFKN